MYNPKFKPKLSLTPNLNVDSSIINLNNNKQIPSQLHPSHAPHSNSLQDSSQTISSKSSAFWPFTKSFQNNPFLSHIISEFSQSQNQSNQHSNFVEDPTQKLFKKLKKAQRQNSFSLDDIVLAKCLNQPLWPAKIIQIEHVPGWFPDGNVYHLKFINQRNTCVIDKQCLIKFNEYHMEQLRKITQNKKLIRAIKMAEKYFNEQLNQQQTQTSQQKITQKSREPQLKQTQVQLSLSSIEPSNVSQNVNQVTKNIEVSNKRFLMMKNVFRPHDFKENTIDVDSKMSLGEKQTQRSDENKDEKRVQPFGMRVNLFKPIILMKGETMEIKLNGSESLNDSEENEQSRDKQMLPNQNQNFTITNNQGKSKEKNLTEENQTRKNKGNLKKVSKNNNDNQKEYCSKIKSKAKPMNLVLQTPRLPPDYYLDKIIFRFNQEEQSYSNDQIKEEKNQNADLDETVMQESNSSKKITFEENLKLKKTKIEDNSKLEKTKFQENTQQVTITKKVNTIKTVKHQTNLPLKSDKKTIDKLNKYLHQMTEDLEGSIQITLKKNKENQIIQFLSLPLPFALKHNNYIEYDKLLKNSAQIIQKFNTLNIDELFILNLKQKLTFIWEFLTNYNGQNCLVHRLRKRCLSNLDLLFNTEMKPKCDSNQNCEREEKNKVESKKELKKISKKRDGRKSNVKEVEQVNENGEDLKRIKIKLKKMIVLSSDEEGNQEQETKICHNLVD